MKMYTATTIGRNSKQPKNASCVLRLVINPSAVSANLKIVRRYTASVATNVAAAKTLNSLVVSLRLLQTNARKMTMKRKKEKT